MVSIRPVEMIRWFGLVLKEGFFGSNRIKNYDRRGDSPQKP